VGKIYSERERERERERVSEREMKRGKTVVDEKTSTSGDSTFIRLMTDYAQLSAAHGTALRDAGDACIQLLPLTRRHARRDQ